ALLGAALGVQLLLQRGQPPAVPGGGGSGRALAARRLRSGSRVTRAEVDWTARHPEDGPKELAAHDRQLSHGPQVSQEGSPMTCFAVWAPAAERVRLRVNPDPDQGPAADHPLQPGANGWWHVQVPGAGHGTDYGFLLDDDPRLLPDPRSRWQPAGVHGPSRLYGPNGYDWKEDGWTGRQLAGSLIYELHVGTFTAEGTFDAAAERVDPLVRLGVDVVGVVRVNGFKGVHNGGYGGVCWYTVQEPYGGPDGLKRFVDACHGRGLGVVLDVVYNHFGDSGNYLP